MTNQLKVIHKKLLLALTRYKFFQKSLIVTIYVKQESRKN